MTDSTAEPLAAKTALAGDWRVWLADNLVHGIPADEMLGVLESNGVARDLGMAEIAAIQASTAFAVARAQALRAARLEQVLQLVRARAAVRSIERRLDPPPGEFFARYWAAGIPFVATDVVTRWPALARWSPQWFREHYGEVEIEASVGREADPDYDINFAAHRQRLTMAAYVERVLDTTASNDCYLIANNHNLARPGLCGLFDDITVPPYLDPDRLVGSSALWFGPTGTTTSLHHDTSNILFCQVYGRKRVLLGDPCDSAMIEHCRGVYCDLDPATAAQDLPSAGPRLFTVELGPGDALFIPVGWWHHVVAHDVSISIGLNGFRRPNRFEWYKPGALR